MDLKPIKTKKIYEEIVEQVRDLLSEGGLKPGDKLLSERELAERLQVSRASVREALRSLEMMGYIEIRTGEGTFVREASIEDFVKPLAMVLGLEKRAFFHVYEVRRILETAAAALAANRATDDDLQSMEEALEMMENNLATAADPADSAFHYAVAEATHNPVLIKLMNTISDSVHQSVHMARSKLFENTENVAKLLEQHRAVLDAIRAKDPQLARQQMSTHLAFAEDEMSKEIGLEKVKR